MVSLVSLVSPQNSLTSSSSSGGYTKNYEGKRVTGVALNDTWHLKIPPLAEDGSLDWKRFKWEKRKNPGNPPNPPRSGASSRRHVDA